MAPNTSPIFTDTPVIGMVQISTANTNRDGSGTIETVITGAADGTRITRITVKATGTTTAGMVRFYIHDGTNTYLWREVAVTAATPSATVLSFVYQFTLNGEAALALPYNWSLKASTHNSETFNIIAEGGAF